MTVKSNCTVICCAHARVVTPVMAYMRERLERGWVEDISIEGWKGRGWLAHYMMCEPPTLCSTAHHILYFLTLILTTSQNETYLKHKLKIILLVQYSRYSYICAFLSWPTFKGNVHNCNLGQERERELHFLRFSKKRSKRYCVWQFHARTGKKSVGTRSHMWNTHTYVLYCKIHYLCLVARIYHKSLNKKPETIKH